jgi:nucleolar complex protein 3
MPYETAPRIRRPSWDPEDETAIKRLPIKLADGRIRQTGVHLSTLQNEYSEEENEQQQEEEFPEATRVEDVSTGARFGRAAVVDVVGIQLKKERIQKAKEQIAGICQEIISDPENNVSCMKYIKADIDTLAPAGPFKTSPLLFLEGNFNSNSSRSRVN